MKELQKQRDIKWVKQLDPRFLECRSLRHQWSIDSYDMADQYAGRRWHKDAKVVVRYLVCGRCGTMRWDYFEYKQGLFERLKSRYMYPKGYKFVKSEHDADKPAFADYGEALFRQYWNVARKRARR